ncbi:GumC family protein [Aureivirga marina]|uniref:GumC family protein n=1 Tax=Aureivirga marina TaxID=1182451 RepID=UPI0018C9C6BF|nr:polysaccharide biosynthesis tyrosine autokinase [Aureivirga marina]
MQQNFGNEFSFQEEGKEVDIKKEILKYFSYWKWILLSVLIFVTLSFVIYKYSKVIYESNTTILIKDSKGSDVSEIEAFNDLGFVSNKDRNIENEIVILKSRTLLGQVVNELQYNVIYRDNNFLKSKLLYEVKPFEINIVSVDNKTRENLVNFTVNIKTKTSFELLDNEQNPINNFNFGEKIRIEGIEMIILPTKDIDCFVENSISVEVKPIDDVITSLIKEINIGNVDKKSSVIGIKIKGENRARNNALLNKLVEIYNANTVEDKSAIIQNTAKFIDSRISLISKDLFQVDSNEEDFKKQNRLTDLATEATKFVDKIAVSDEKYLEVNTQLSIITYMEEYLENLKENFELLPSNLGLDDLSINKNIELYNSLVLERNRLLKSSTELNPVVVQVSEELKELKINLVNSLKNLKISIELQVKALDRERGKINSKIASVPSKEREFRDIKRTQEIKERLYLYLLEKREENAIKLAIIEPNSKVIDKAYSPKNPIAPKRNIIFLAGIILGLLIPIAIIYSRNLLDTKVHNKSDVTQNLAAPFLGDIPEYNSDNKYLLDKRDRSSTAEAFRLLRTNLDFMLSNIQENGCKTIFTTSTLSKEGKSFTAIHLASTLSDTGKKVLLIGLDLRAPKIMQYLNIPDERKGVTSFIKDKNTSLDEYIVKAPSKENLYLLPSGFIPPNPAELLLSSRIKEMFETAKEEYDYVIVDTAPVSLVTDTLAISKYADMFLYVVRAEVLDKKLLEIPQNLYKERKLPNMAVVLNGTDYKKGYGYGYGYGVHLEEKKNIFQKLFKR